MLRIGGRIRKAYFAVDIIVEFLYVYEFSRNGFIHAHCHINVVVMWDSLVSH